MSSFKPDKRIKDTLKIISLLNIEKYFEDFVSKTKSLIENQHIILFFLNTEMNFIEKIYVNLCAIIIQHAHVYEFYNTNFKFFLAVVHHKIYVFINNSTIDDNPESNISSF